MQVQAWLSYAGPKARETLAASATGPVSFSWEQLDGPRRSNEYGDDVCARHQIERDRPMVVPFTKDGGFPIEPPGLGEVPDSVFWRAYLEDPLFRLPSGRYLVRAVAGFYVATCTGTRGFHSLSTGVEITVLP
jgi:hypothetical protein